MLNYFVYLRGQNIAQTWYIAIYTSKTNYREDLTRLNGYRKKIREIQPGNKAEVCL